MEREGRSRFEEISARDATFGDDAVLYEVIAWLGGSWDMNPNDVTSALPTASNDDDSDCEGEACSTSPQSGETAASEHPPGWSAEKLLPHRRVTRALHRKYRLGGVVATVSQRWRSVCMGHRAFWSRLLLPLEINAYAKGAALSADRRVAAARSTLLAHGRGVTWLHVIGKWGALDAPRAELLPIAMRCCPRLVRLELSAIRLPSDSPLIMACSSNTSVGPPMPSLQELIVHYCSGISSRAVREIKRDRSY